jgi:subtilisin family serine protease
VTRSARSLLALLAVLALLVPAGPAAAAGAPPQQTWHAQQARVPEARAAGRDGEGVLVAVLDTWVDAAHRDFEGRVVTGADCTTGTCREGAPVADQCDHGTHVAGTVASSSYGVAPRASVLPVRVLAYDASATPPACNGSVGGVAAGIRYAVAKGARVVNLSLGTLVPGLSSSSAISAAVDEAARAGVLVVFAAGNSSVPVTDSYGGSALIVAATGPSGQLAGYSQRGAGVSLAAPGGDPQALGSCSPSSCVTSLFPTGRYAVAAGTSMAAPHVAGTAALLLAQDPARTRDQVAERLRGTARPLPGAGSGLLDAAAALSSAPVRPEPVAPASEAPAGSPAQVPPAVSVEVPPPAAPAPPPSPGAGAGTAELPPSALPLPEQPPDDTTAAEQPSVADPVPLADGPPPVAASDVDALPTGPVTLAVALLAAAALSSAAVGLSRRSPSR